MKSNFCRHCLLRNRCKDFCGLKETDIIKILDEKIGDIRWINLTGPTCSAPDFFSYNSELEYSFHDEYYVVLKEKNWTTIYLPYFSRLYIVPNNMIEYKKNILFFKKEYFKLGVISGLLISENEKCVLQKSYIKADDGITLRVAFSSGCTLNCIYCYADPQAKNHEINIENFSFFVKNIKNEYKINNIELHGNGEPTFKIKELKNVVNIIKQYLGTIPISMQSNGQFSKDIAEWLLKNNIEVGFSMDGSEYIQNKQRPNVFSNKSSFDLINNNISFMNEHKKKIGIISTITKYNEKNIIEIYKYFKEIGTKLILFNPLVKAGKSKEGFSEENDFFVSNNFFINSYLQVLKMAFFDGILVSSRFLPSVHYGSRLHRCSVCNGRLVYLPDGRIVSCSEPVMDDESIDNPFLVGNCDNKELLINKRKQLITHSRRSDKMTECYKCIAKWTCSGGCLADSYIKYKDIFKVVIDDCHIRKQLLTEYLEFLSEQSINSYYAAE